MGRRCFGPSIDLDPAIIFPVAATERLMTKRAVKQYPRMVRAMNSQCMGSGVNTTAISHQYDRIILRRSRYRSPPLRIAYCWRDHFADVGNMVACCWRGERKAVGGDDGQHFIAIEPAILNGLDRFPVSLYRLTMLGWGWWGGCFVGHRPISHALIPRSSIALEAWAILRSAARTRSFSRSVSRLTLPLFRISETTSSQVGASLSR